ncbi:MAG: hypothetical protein R2699_07560 [Acidimicrobiales bacterium]
MTDDLPTPPLPDATASTFVVGGTCVGSALLCVCSGARRSGGLLLARELGPGEGHPLDAGQRLDPGTGVALDLCPQRASGGGEGDRHVDVVAVDDDVLGHAELHDVGAELGVDDAAEQLAHVVRRHGRGADGVLVGRRAHGTDSTGAGRVNWIRDR